MDEVVRAVREQAARGADWIKLYADYRVGPAGEAEATFSLEELKAATEVAHSLGRPVAVHTTSTEGMRRAFWPASTASSTATAAPKSCSG